MAWAKALPASSRQATTMMARQVVMGPCPWEGLGHDYIERPGPGVRVFTLTPKPSDPNLGPATSRSQNLKVTLPYQ